jgi:hypothetical protein
MAPLTIKEFNMSNDTKINQVLLRLIAAAALGTAGLSLAACDANDGPAEEMGESLDNAADETGDAFDDAADSTEDAFDDMADEIDDGIDEP